MKNSDILIKIDKIIEYGIYTFVFLLAWQTRWFIRLGELKGVYSEYLTISLYCVDVILIFLLILAIIGFFLKKGIAWRRPQINNYWWIIAFLELIIFISIFFSSDKLLSFYKYGLFLLGMSLFWLLAYANYKTSKLFFYFLFGIAIQAILGIWQFLTQSSFACKWLGLAWHDPSISGTSVIEVANFGERWLRAYGGFDHPNIFGGVMAVSLIIAIFYFLKIRSEKYAEKVFYYFIILLFFTALFFSFSRAAWLSAFFGMLITMILILLKKDLLKLREFLKIILASSILIFILFIQYNNLIMTRLSGTARLEVKSNIERIELMHSSKNLIQNKWLFGHGVGNYVLALSKNDNSAQNLFYQPDHNVFLLIWAEIGIFGLLGYLWLLGYLIRINKKSIIALPVLLIFVIIMIFDHWLWSLHFGILFFWMIIGIIVKIKFKDKLSCIMK